MAKTDDMQVRFDGPRTRADTVAVDVLTASLEALQKLVHLLALRQEGDEPAQGSHTPEERRRRYSLVCRLPERGSYTIPLAIGEEDYETDPAANVHADLRRLFLAVQRNDERDVESLFPSPRTRAAVARTLKNMLPKSSSGIRLSIQSRSGKDLLVQGETTSRFLGSLAATRAENEIERSLVGHLKEIDFDKRRIKLQHPPTGRQLSCTYPRQIERELVDWGRDLVQVVGEVTVGTDDVPKRIRNVDAVHRVDLSPIELTGFLAGGRRVRARRAVTFKPELDDAYQGFVLHDAPFGVHLMSTTREELETNLQEEMDVLWRHYASCDDATLTSAARELKQQLNGAFHTA